MARVKIPRKKKQKLTAGHSVRNVLQCKSDTVKRKRCRKRTAHTKKCWIHLAKEDNLRIKKSLIPNAGKGLFAWKKPFRSHRNLGIYTGYKTTKAKINRRYGRDVTATYNICNDPRNCIDAYLSTDGAPRFANCAYGTAHQNNSIFTYNHQSKLFKLKSSKPIKAGAEILADYGDNYWP